MKYSNENKMWKYKIQKKMGSVHEGLPWEAGFTKRFKRIDWDSSQIQQGIPGEWGMN